MTIEKEVYAAVDRSDPMRVFLYDESEPNGNEGEAKNIIELLDIKPGECVKVKIVIEEIN